MVDRPLCEEFYQCHFAISRYVPLFWLLCYIIRSLSISHRCFLWILTRFVNLPVLPVWIYRCKLPVWVYRCELNLCGLLCGLYLCGFTCVNYLWTLPVWVYGLLCGFYLCGYTCMNYLCGFYLCGYTCVNYLCGLTCVNVNCVNYSCGCTCVDMNCATVWTYLCGQYLCYPFGFYLRGFTCVDYLRRLPA